MEKPCINIMWFRRDLRIEDNAAFYHALNSGTPVLPIFIFDKNILDSLRDKYDRRVDFIFSALESINRSLEKFGSGIQYCYGTPEEVFEKLAANYSIGSVFTNEDYEPYAIARDSAVKELLKNSGSDLLMYKDQVIFEKSEVLKADATPYTIYSPYARAWHLKITQNPAVLYTSENLLDNLLKFKPKNFGLGHIGFQKTNLQFKPYEFSAELLKAYSQNRSIPHLDATSRISIHLRFGTVSIRKAVKLALEHSFKFYRELIWRDFFMQILYHFPHTQHKSFKPAYDNIKWLNREEDFEKWKTGTTGFPLVDAGMRELNATGFMHNRVRMLSASFLIKDLLVDWRWGEAYFAEKLLDYDLSQNIGNWQWCAGSGCDAAPYFRIFNPELQLQKFDPGLKYIKKWVPEFGTNAYPVPMLDHKEARARAIKTFKDAIAVGSN